MKNPLSVNINAEEGYVQILHGNTEVHYWDIGEWTEDPEVVFSIMNAINQALTDPDRFIEVARGKGWISIVPEMVEVQDND
jgi:hypothetical protein